MTAANASELNTVTRALDILDAEKLLFPGVGNYENMIRILNEKNYIEPLREYLAADRPLFRHLPGDAGPF